MQKSPASSISRLTIARPDDWHLHIRDGEMMAAVLAYTARQFARAIIMPNLKPPITTAAMAAAYRERTRADRIAVAREAERTKKSLQREGRRATRKAKKVASKATKTIEGALK